MILQNTKFILSNKPHYIFLVLTANTSNALNNSFVKSQVKVALKNKLKTPATLMFSNNNLKKTSVCVRIKVTSNNVFCTFWSLNGLKTFKVCSAGMKKVTISKKRLFFGAKLVIQSFIYDLKLWKKSYRNKNTLFFYSLNAPTKIRNFIIRTIIKHAATINIEYSKPFNGCTARKKRRKKRLRFRSFK